MWRCPEEGEGKGGEERETANTKQRRLWGGEWEKKRHSSSSPSGGGGERGLLSPFLEREKKSSYLLGRGEENTLQSFILHREGCYLFLFYSWVGKRTSFFTRRQRTQKRKSCDLRRPEETGTSLGGEDPGQKKST